MNINTRFIDSVRKCIFLSGMLILLTIFLMQQTLMESFKSSDKIILTENQIIFMDSIAIHTLVVYSIGMILISLGISFFIKKWTKQTYFSYSTNRIKKYYYIFKNGIYFIFTNTVSRRFFIASFIVYFLVSLFLNNTIVYNSNDNDIHHNQKAQLLHSSTDNTSYTPSIFILACCGNPGTFPVVSIHLTESIGIILIPVNIMLPFFYSFSIAIALGTIALTITNDRKEKLEQTNKRSCTMTGLGAIAGFFISCPTCTANIIASSMMSTGIITSSSLIMYSYQPLIAIVNFVVIFWVLIYIMKKNLSSKQYFKSNL